MNQLVSRRPPDFPTLHRNVVFGHAGGRFTCSHWDGDTKPLLPFARETGLDGIEAITPKPQGDVTLEEIKDALVDEYNATCT